MKIKRTLLIDWLTNDVMTILVEKNQQVANDTLLSLLQHFTQVLMICLDKSLQRREGTMENQEQISMNSYIKKLP